MDPFDRHLAELDAAQREAVFHPRGPLLLVAGAGAGKTRVIVARIVRLIRDGAPPSSILGITFTNRAAEEMRDRVRRALDGAAEPPWLGTFHAYGALLLRRFGSRIGVPPGFLIYDERDRDELLRQVLRDHDIDEKRFPAARFAAVIERAKREGVTAEAASFAAGWPFAAKAQVVARAYAEALAEAGAVDFADLIRLPAELLRRDAGVLEAVRSEVRHLLVDEFQDVDAGQALLARLIGAGAESYCAVGDDDQSIYGWRGGSAGPMLSFERDHPGAALVHLATNYRSRAAILAAAGAVIARNRARREKAVVPARAGGPRPLVCAYEDADDEARGTAGRVAAAARRGVLPSELAVFYRVNAQSRPIEDALRREGIPYVLRGALSFYDRAAVRDALAYLRWFLSPDDAVSLRRLLSAPRRGAGAATLSRAKEAARSGGTAWISELAKVPALRALCAFRERWITDLPGRRLGEALRALLEGAGYLEWLGRRGEPGGAAGADRSDDARENVEELLRLAEAFGGEGEEAARAFLEAVSLSPRETARADGEAVRLMTLHNAKGLEFEEVFLVGLEEGLLPHARARDDGGEVEEERRLFYVGLTRARERATLSFARRRRLFGEYRDAVPSRFLAEIPDGLVEFSGGAQGASPYAGAGRGGAQRFSFGARVAFPAARPPERAGAAGAGAPRRVRHPVFGEGRIEAVEGEGAERKIVARFPSHGIKRILARAVKLEFPE